VEEQTAARTAIAVPMRASNFIVSENIAPMNIARKIGQGVNQ
jgi:hypothetical protein